MSTTITKTAFFTANKETVWSFLTDKTKLGQWFFEGQADMADGSDYALMGKEDDGTPVKRCWGKVEKWNPHSELEYTFTIAPLGGHFTSVNWKLEDAGTGTKLTLEHSGLSAEGDALILITHLDSGWDRHIASLRESVAA